MLVRPSLFSQPIDGFPVSGAVSFLPTSSNYGTCADSLFGKITPAEKGEKAVSDASPTVFPPFFSV